MTYGCAPRPSPASPPERRSSISCTPVLAAPGRNDHTIPQDFTFDDEQLLTKNTALRVRKRLLGLGLHCVSCLVLWEPVAAPGNGSQQSSMSSAARPHACRRRRTPRRQKAVEQPPPRRTTNGLRDQASALSCALLCVLTPETRDECAVVCGISDFCTRLYVKSFIVSPVGRAHPSSVFLGNLAAQDTR